MRCSKRVHVTPHPQKIVKGTAVSGRQETELKIWPTCLCGKVENKDGKTN